MKLNIAIITILSSSYLSENYAFTIPSHSIGSRFITSSSSSSSGQLAVAAVTEENETSTDNNTDLDYESVNKLTFRQLQKECKERGLVASGTTAALRGRLLEHFNIQISIVPPKATSTTVDDEENCIPDGIEFCDESDKNFEFNSLVKEITEKASVGHWKSATRKLKKLTKCYATPENPIPRDLYITVLESCLSNRLHGARASEPARKILEEMAEQGYEIPTTMGNQCVMNCLGNGPNRTHDGCGGIDTALAMLAALESSPESSGVITEETYGAVVSALSQDGAVDESVLLLRAMVVEHSFTPPLSIFADVASAAAKVDGKEEVVLQVMTLAKAAGYILDNIASAQAGRELLASGVIAAEKMDNLALGLRLLTAAGKAEGCLPDRGDDLVAASSAAAQRASTLIHKRAIDAAIADDNWKLAVRLLELMPQRSLSPSTSVWRKVVTICAKNSKSKKATAILLDWVKLAEEGKTDVPPLNVFNTVVNTCEICGEEDLTLLVLDAMRKAHETDGNIITFNIALKRLAKQGNTIGCEGIIIGMLQNSVEPNVVTYTTAIGACVQANDSKFAYEWLKRMRSRNVKPNFHTYNTALAACLDGKLESTVRGATIASEMMRDVTVELNNGYEGNMDYNSVIPDSYTKVLARNLMKQLRDNWRAGDINMAVAKSTLRVPLLKLVDFNKSEAAAKVEKQRQLQRSIKKSLKMEEEDVDKEVEKTEIGLDYNLVSSLQQRRTMEV